MEYLSKLVRSAFPSDSSIPVLSISPGFPKLAAWRRSETMWSQFSGVLVEKKAHKNSRFQLFFPPKL
jgi:hypothetical protein